MRPSLHPRLINGPFDDPGLFISFLFSNRAIMFDLGDLAGLSSRDILKISHVFVTHTHMDHFVGFDRLLRLNLGREKSIYLYGPQGFRKNVEGKLAGYAWNLVENYSNSFTLHVTEVLSDQLITTQYFSAEKFVPARKSVVTPFSDILLEEPALTVSTVLLDHSIPCLGFAIREKFHVNIMKDQVLSLGLETGPWLDLFKQSLYSGKSPASEFVVEFDKKNRQKKTFNLGELAKHIAMISPGQEICYIVDVAYTESNAAKIIEFTKEADQLYIEAAFLEKDAQVARFKNHLTARQAGIIAGKSRVKQFTIFHFSPRYTTQGHLLEQEALQAYQSALIKENHEE